MVDFSIARSFALSALFIGLSASVAVADTITVGGTTLEGKILAIDAGSVRFETIYGRGAIEIKLEDIQAITTDENFFTAFGDDERAHGRILGIEQQHLVFGDDRESAIPIPIDSGITSVSVARYDSSLLARLRQDFRYWNANFDVALEFEEGVVDKRKLALGARMERRKKPTRFIGDFRLAFEDQSDDEGNSITTKDEVGGFVRGEFDVLEGAFVYGSGSAERDVVRNINLRAIPTAGIGYRFIDDKNALFQTFAGLGYVYEDFDGFPTNDYVAADLGLEFFYEFDNGIETRGRVFWLPSVTDPSENWLYNSTVEFSFPIADPLALKVRMTDVYDNNPAPGTTNNKLTTSMGLSFRF